MATINALLGSTLEEVKISELPPAAQANASDMLEASQVDGAGWTTRSIILDQVSTVVAASSQIEGVIDAAIGDIPATDWSTITNKPATFPPTVPIAYTDISGKPSTFPPTIPTGGAIAAWPFLPLTGGTLTGALTGTFGTFTVGADAVVTPLVVGNDSSGAAAETILQQYVGTKGVNRRLSFTGNYMQESSGSGIVSRYSDFNTHFFRDSAGAAVATLAAGAGNSTLATSPAFPDNTTKIATTAFVTTALPTTLPPNGAAGGDLAGTYPNPTIKANVALTGNPTAPTPTAGDNDTSIATTAFVTAAVGSSGIPPGAIMDYAGASAPAGWLLCQGQAVSRTGANTALFAAIGTTWGAGDGSTTFNVPDLGGRVTAGKEVTATRLTAGGSGITGSTLGSAGGAEIHTLTGAQLPAHAHNPIGSLFIVNTGGQINIATFQAGNDVNLHGSSSTSSSGGSGAAHQNTQPTIIMNKIIKV